MGNFEKLKSYSFNHPPSSKKDQAMSQQRNLINFMKDSKWEPMGNAYLAKLGFIPNRIYQNWELREVIILLKQSKTGACALGAPVVSHYLNSIDSGSANQVYVVQTDKGDNFLVQNTLKNVAKELNGHEPNKSTRPGMWCDYWWITSDWRISLPGDFDPTELDMSKVL